ncbi:hypothetical protein J7T55_003334 [Diaporthe amygdali]|uniref:uncharacterized protein n=1 Tax=Phomopsis amygdali TaxID=1214568 RepID=UPI0022FED73C|nr:uncharacterized protein J7T55_003334 [Diaporthe amygdali]KAJ0116920.1 hypothetical protein J7T55_003334 [Diaporthe amygdali]
MTKIVDMAEDTSKDAPRGSKCTCDPPRRFKKEESRSMLGSKYCDYCGGGPYDHYWRCQKTCHRKFCNSCMDTLGYSKDKEE